MLGIDVGHDRDGAVEAQETAVALVSFDDHPVGGAQACIRTIAELMIPPLITVGSTPPASSSAAIIEVVVVLPCVPATATVDFSRISSASISARRMTGTRRSSARSTSGLPFSDRGRGDHHRRIAQILGLVADHHLDTEIAQVLDDIALGHVAALHAVAHIVHDLGNTGHADAADADEMDRPDIGANALHAPAPARPVMPNPGSRTVSTVCGAGPKLSIRSARSRAASGRPQDFARSAALTSAPGSMASFCICLASSAAVKRLWSMARAASGDHLAHIIGLVIVHGTREGNENGGPPGGGQFGDSGCTGARNDEMRPAQLFRHVLDIGREIGGISISA